MKYQILCTPIDDVISLFLLEVVVMAVVKAVVVFQASACLLM